jgi:hypothetical protein
MPTKSAVLELSVSKEESEAKKFYRRRREKLKFECRYLNPLGTTSFFAGIVLRRTMAET